MKHLLILACIFLQRCSCLHFQYEHPYPSPIFKGPSSCSKMLSQPSYTLRLKGGGGGEGDCTVQDVVLLPAMAIVSYVVLAGVAWLLTWILSIWETAWSVLVPQISLSFQRYLADARDLGSVWQDKIASFGLKPWGSLPSAKEKEQPIEPYYANKCHHRDAASTRLLVSLLAGVFAFTRAILGSPPATSTKQERSMSSGFYGPPVGEMYGTRESSNNWPVIEEGWKTG